MRVIKFLSFFMLAVVQKNDVCAATVSRSLISRVITSARNHPIMTAAGLVGTGYLFYRLLHKKRALLPNPALLAPGLRGQPGAALPQEQDELLVMFDPNPTVDPIEERERIGKVLYDDALLPRELIKIILGYHFVPFRGVEVSRLTNDQFQDDSCGSCFLFALSKKIMVQVYGNYLNRNNDNPRVIVKLWNVETSSCEQCITVARGLVRFAFLDENKKLFIQTSQNKTYELDLSSFEKKESSKDLSVFERRLDLPIKIVLRDGKTAKADKENNITIKNSNGKKEMQFAACPAKYGNECILQLIELPGKQLLVKICSDNIFKHFFVVWDISSNPPICVKQIKTSAIGHGMLVLEDGRMVTQGECAVLSILR